MADNSKLDSNQTISFSYDEAALAHRVIGVNSLIPAKYDSIALSYIESGDGEGQVGTVSYYQDFDLIAMLSLAYDSSNRLITVTRT